MPNSNKHADLTANDAALPDKHSIESLRYRLFLGSVDIAPLRILAFRQISWLDWLVTFTILGASHALKLTRSDETIGELLTCAPPTAEGEPIKERRPPDNGFSASVCDLQWNWRSVVEPCGQNPVLRSPADESLTTRFPAGLEAVTMIGWFAGKSGLRVETVHTYPEEARLIRTWTHIRPGTKR